MSLVAIALLVLIVAVLVAIYFIFASFAWGAGYQPAPGRVVRKMLELGEVGPSDRLYDLGAGTGAIIFRAARELGATAVGVELEPLRIAILRVRRRWGANPDRVSIRWGDIFSVDLSSATVVTAFLWPEAMARLRPIFEAQLRAGARVVSHWHPVPGWTVEAEDPRLRVYLYRMPPRPSEPPTGTREH
jgi:SAM-dependent methyltransferase